MNICGCRWDSHDVRLSPIEEAKPFLRDELALCMAKMLSNSRGNGARQFASEERGGVKIHPLSPPMHFAPRRDGNDAEGAWHGGGTPVGGKRGPSSESRLRRRPLLRRPRARLLRPTMTAAAGPPPPPMTVRGRCGSRPARQALAEPDAHGGVGTQRPRRRPDRPRGGPSELSAAAPGARRDPPWAGSFRLPRMSSRAALLDQEHRLEGG